MELMAWYWWAIFTLGISLIISVAYLVLLSRSSEILEMENWIDITLQDRGNRHKAGK